MNQDSVTHNTHAGEDTFPHFQYPRSLQILMNRIMSTEAAQITKMLGDVRSGNPQAAEQLMEAIYSDLRGMACRIFASERPDHTLQPTALVHEAWVRIFSGAEVPWNDRVHFYAVAARQMRRILTDHGREFRAVKRGAGLKVSFDDRVHNPAFADCEFNEVNQLLERLQRADPRAGQVVELKFFSGMTDEEVAAELKCSQAQVRRDWSFAKAWLVSRMTAPPAPEKS
jgi:RNA polymerase sigma factor (TIGR02999 family)